MVIDTAKQQIGRPVQSSRSRLAVLWEPAGYQDGMSLYEYVGAGPVGRVDPTGNAMILTAPDPSGLGISVGGMQSAWFLGFDGYRNGLLEVPREWLPVLGVGLGMDQIADAGVSGICPPPAWMAAPEENPLDADHPLAFAFIKPSRQLPWWNGFSLSMTTPADAFRNHPPMDAFNVAWIQILRPEDWSGRVDTVSAGGIAFIKAYEQLWLMPYDDQTRQPISEWVRGATVGWGHLIRNEQWVLYANGITTEQADALFVRDLQRTIQAVNRSLKVDVSQHQFDALVSLAYNIGTQAFAGSSVLKLINDPKALTEFRNLESAWKAWRKSGDQVMQGLVNRRMDEWELFSAGDYTRNH